jgi:hypothetical protein
MSNDLISRSKLTKAMFQYVKGEKTIGQIIDEQPTAYDVDKVIEELKKSTGSIAHCDNREDCNWCLAHAQCEIIKQGGIR